jgi:hypothetical protein
LNFAGVLHFWVFFSFLILAIIIQGIYKSCIKSVVMVY